MTEQYNLANIRTLLIKGFTAEDLRLMCFDESSLRSVHDELSVNMGKAEIIDRLLEHAQSNLLLDLVLDLARQRNPARYHMYEPYRGGEFSSESGWSSQSNFQFPSLPLHQLPSPAPLPLNSRMPFSRNPFFVGRQNELRYLAKALQIQDLQAEEVESAMQVVIATGLGGIGKTQLAVEFIHRYGQFFPGGVFWLNFAEATNVPAEIAACRGAVLLDLQPDFEKLDLNTQVNLVLSAWQNPLPRLLIFDHCEEEALLNQWLPRMGGCKVLVTSRRPNWSTALSLQVLSLDTLNKTESVALLCDYRPDLSRTEAEAIANELGGLPLALHLAGSYLGTYNTSPRKFLTELRNTLPLRYPVLQGKDEKFPLNDHELHIGQTLALSYYGLRITDQVNNIAIKLLNRAAYFAPDELIPRSLLLATLQLSPSDRVTAHQAMQALSHLVQLGLLSREEEDAIRLHRLIGSFVRGVETQQDEVANKWESKNLGNFQLRGYELEFLEAQAAVETTLLAEAFLVNRSGDSKRLLAWQVHLRAITERAQERKDERAAGLCNEFGYYLQSLGNYTAARPYLEQALAIREDVLGLEHSETIDTLNNLATLFYAQGDYRTARSYYERLLVVQEQLLGSDHPDIAFTLNNFANLLYAQANYIPARMFYERALAIREKVLGSDHPDTAVSLNNLGSLLQTQGDLAGARPYLERALAIREKVLGSDHPGTAVSLNNLGNLLQAQGDLADARPYLERALAIREKVLGSDHPDTAVSLNNLGNLLQAQGDLAGARPYLERALAIREKVLGSDHPDTAVSLNNLALLLREQGDYSPARTYYQRALLISEKVLGPDHPYNAVSLNNLGRLLQAQGDLAGARPYLERALAIRERVLGRDHPDTANSLSGLGKLLQAQGDLNEARDHLERALTIQQQALEETHPTIARTLNNLGSLLHDQGEFDTARSHLERALSIWRKTKGPADSPDEILTLNNLGLLLWEVGETEKAETYFKRSLVVLERNTSKTYQDRSTSANDTILKRLHTINEDMIAARRSRSQRAQTAGLSRAIGRLSELQSELSTRERPEPPIFKRIIDRWQTVITRQIGRAGEMAILKPVSSPYIFTPPVKGVALIGRKDVFDRINSIWARPGQRNSVLIHGHRRMGKTSVAQALETRCHFGKDTRLVYLSLEGQILKQEGDLYQLLADRIWLRFKDKLTRPDPKQFHGEKARGNFDFFMAELDEVIGNTRVVVVLDEFEMLYNRLNPDTAHEVIAFLRARTVTYTWLALALVGLSDLEDLSLSYGNPLLGWENIKVSFMDANQVANILANPPQDPDFPLDYTLEALNTIATLTNGQPYLVQVIGDRLVQRYNHIVFTEQNNHNGIFDVTDVQAVINAPGFFATGAAYFEGIWNQAAQGQAGEVDLLKSLALHEGGLTKTELQAAVNLTEAEFKVALTSLERHDVVVRKNNHLCFAVPLMQRWVKEACIRREFNEPEK